MRLPGGAVTPAMKPTTGFFMCSLHQRAASASSGPPISPIMMTASVSGSSLNMRMTSMCLSPLIGSPPIPTALDWPIPSSVSCATASYVRVPLRDTTPTRPLRWIWPGMMPILISSGVMTPGQFGPNSRVRLPPAASLDFILLRTSSMSRIGMPSVMQTTRSRSASTASQMAAAAPAGGT